jgi:hypothetical protein
MSMKNLIDKPKTKQWIDTSKWSKQPTKGKTFRIGSQAFTCHRIFHQWARLSWVNTL